MLVAPIPVLGRGVSHLGHATQTLEIYDGRPAKKL
jgi:hypothetical protein